MTLVDNLTDNAYQDTAVQLEDGTSLTLTLRFLPATERWIYSVSHPDLTLNGAGLCVYPNLLRQWINQITFGLACLSADGADPAFIDDFISGRITLYTLNAADIASVESQFFTPA